MTAIPCPASLLALVWLAIAAAGADEWRPVPSPPAADRFASYSVLPGGDVLRSTSDGSDSVFSQRAERWHPVPPPRRRREPRIPHAACVTLVDGRVLAVGGERILYPDQGAFEALASCELYDPRTDTWRPTGNLRVPRTSLTLVALADGRALAAGGFGTTLFPMSSWNVLASAEIWDPRTGRWQETPPMSSGHANGYALTLADGRVVVYGVQTNEGARSAPNAVADVFDPRRDRWTRTRNDPYPPSYVAEAMILLRDGRVLVLGAGSAFSPFDEGARVLSPSTLTWSRLGTIHANDASGVVLDDGTVLACGGAHIAGLGDGPLAATFLLPPGSNRWSAGPAMHQGRYRPILLRLPGDRALVITSEGTSTCEVYEHRRQGCGETTAWELAPTARN